MKKAFNFVFIVIILTVFRLNGFYKSGLYLYGNDIKLKYDLSVNAVIIPVFALDKKGNPVFDLKKKDLVLYVEGNPVDINSLSRYSLEEEKKYSEKVKKTIKTPVIKREKVVRERYIFLIIDSIFNSRDGYRRTKEIAEKLIIQGKSSDKFIVIELHPLKGLNYIGGPETGNKFLVERIKSLKLNFNKWSNELFRQKLLGSSFSNDLYGVSEQKTKRFMGLSKAHNESERMRYRNQIIRYSSMLSKFKYALKSITKPKMIFLISEGMAQGSFLETSRGFTSQDGEILKKIADFKKEHSGFNYKFQQWSTLYDSERKDNFKLLFSGMMLGYLGDIVKSINRGNSVLYSINPAKPSDTHDSNISGEMSLKYLAGESGGEYYAGTNAVEIVERINKNTSAYYELSFLIPENIKKNLHIKIRCKRKGVNVNTVQYTELKKKYSDMDKLQKRVFAYNLARGGKWSNLIAKVVNAKINIKKTEGKKENSFEVEFPEAFVGKNADIFIITEDMKNRKVDIKKRKKVLIKATEEIRIKNEENKKYYLAVVELGETRSISLQLK